MASIINNLDFNVGVIYHIDRFSWIRTRGGSEGKQPRPLRVGGYLEPRVPKESRLRDDVQLPEVAPEKIP